MDSNDRADKHLRRMILGGSVGNVLEWYDFAVFGYFAAMIGTQFFPKEDNLAALINAFGVFAAGYLMRPIGGVIFGHMGDRLGRKKALQISVAMMAIPTTLLGLLPSYAHIGVTASVLLVLLRLIQGVSVGGELIGSISFVTEMSPAKRRGFFGSLTLCSAVAGVLLGSAVASLLHSILDQQALHAWGWRLPFLAGFLIGGFGLWMRSGLAETPDFEAARSQGRLTKSPVVEVIRTMPGKIVQTAGLVVVMGGGFYMLFVWWPTYLTTIVKPAVPHALGVNTICMLVFMCLIPVYGWLSDRWGRKTVLAFGALGLAIAAYPMFAWADHGTITGALVAGLVFAALVSATQGPMPATLVELFPAQTRFSGIALGYNITLGLVGGTAPLISTWLIQKTGNITSPAFYLIIMAAVSFAAALTLPRGHGRDT